MQKKSVPKKSQPSKKPQPTLLLEKISSDIANILQILEDKFVESQEDSPDTPDEAA